MYAKFVFSLNFLFLVYSKIFLDKNNARNQTLILSKIMEQVLGKKRLPMLIIDKKPILNNRSAFNAKAAAIYGFSLLIHV